MRFKFLPLILISIFSLTAAIGCRGGDPTAKKVAKEEIKLTLWTVYDAENNLKELINGYTAINANVRIDIRRFNFQEYQNQLLDAFAEDRGPDLFALPNTWVQGYANKITFLPDSITLPVKVTKGTVKKETVIELQTKKTLSPKELKTKFVDVVASDAAFQTSIEVEGKKQQAEKIFALPLAVDVLAMYYNGDMLNAAGISEPAKDWNEFANHVRKIVKLDSQGNILQAGASMGTGKNIDRASDIISMLMMQNSVEMAKGTSISFNQFPTNYDRERTILPGEEALIFYTDFASKDRDTYTWNLNMPNALEAFVSGQVAYFFGYSYHREQILQRAPRLNFNVATAPTIPGNPNVYFANYWMYTVSKKTKHADWAWDFLLFATDSKNVEKYLTELKKPSGLRSLVDKQKEDPDMKAFAEMVLTSKSWYHGKDAATADRIMQEMIDSVVEGRAKSIDALLQAASMVQQTMR
jgi:ABC-type glycerol-3-phosphate transport system substrate-binding protein